MKLFIFLLKRAPGSIAVSVIAGIICGISNVVLLGFFTDALRNTGPANPTAILAFFGICVFLPVTRFVSENVLMRLSQSFLYSLQVRLSRQILAAPLIHLEELGVPRLLGALTEDIPIISGSVVLLPSVSINVAIIIAGLVYLGWLSSGVLAVMVGLMLVGIILYQIPTLKGFHYFRLARADSNTMLKHFRDLTAGTKELKLHRHRRHAFLTEVLESTAASLRKRNIMGMTLFSAAGSAGQLMAFLIIGLILFILPRFQEIDARTMTGYTVTILYLMTPLQFIMDTLPRLTRARVALGNIEDMRLTLVSRSENVAVDAPSDVDGYLDRLELIGITHTYTKDGGNETFTLGPIDLVLLPGELVFISGGNGSGKTTLAKLITGLYVPQAGEVRLNGRSITNETRESYRQHFSVVFQDFHLFDGLFGLGGCDLDEQVRKYLATLQLDHKVAIKDGMFSSTALSQGQRRRLALLTAYVEDRPVYVFDEWAADQDPLFKDIFYYKLLPELKAKGKTVLVVSHDDRYYDVADRVIKLDYGKIDHNGRSKCSAPEAAATN